MAKVSFTKLGLKVNQEVKIVEWNEQKIEVKQYISVQEKLELISNVINMAHDGVNNYSNPVKVDTYIALEILGYYTNINFTEKQKEDFVKVYDLFKGNGLLDKIIQAIPEKEYNSLIDGAYRSIDAIYAYHNSVLGILDAIGTDYDNLNLDVNELKEKMVDPEQLGLLRNVLDKLG